MIVTIRTLLAGTLLVQATLLAQTPPKAEFTGSVKCRPCRAATYARWKKTLMANVLQDAKAKPEAVLGDILGCGARSCCRSVCTWP